MTEEFTPRYCSCIWYYEHLRGNLLAQLWKEKGQWVCIVRTRFYMDDKMHDSADQKTGSSFACEVERHTEPDCRAYWDEKLTELSDMLTGPMGFLVEKDFIDMSCMEDDPKFFFELSSKSWAHPKILTAAESEELLRKRDEGKA